MVVYGTANGETVDLGRIEHREMRIRRVGGGGAHEGNLAGGVVFRDTERVVVSVTGDDEFVCDYGGGHVAEKRPFLQPIQVGHSAAAAALLGPVDMVVVGESLDTAALR